MPRRLDDEVLVELGLDVERRPPPTALARDVLGRNGQKLAGLRHDRAAVGMGCRQHRRVRPHVHSRVPGLAAPRIDPRAPGVGEPVAKTCPAHVLAVFELGAGLEPLRARMAPRRILAPVRSAKAARSCVTSIFRPSRPRHRAPSCARHADRDRRCADRPARSASPSRQQTCRPSPALAARCAGPARSAPA